MVWPNHDTKRDCETCRFSSPCVSEDGQFECRRHPPKLISHHIGLSAVGNPSRVIDTFPAAHSFDEIGQIHPDYITRFPLVDCGEWCGEYAAKVPVAQFNDISVITLCINYNEMVDFVYDQQHRFARLCEIVGVKNDAVKMPDTARFPAGLSKFGKSE